MGRHRSGGGERRRVHSPRRAIDHGRSQFARGILRPRGAVWLDLRQPSRPRPPLVHYPSGGGSTTPESEATCVLPPPRLRFTGSISPPLIARSVSQPLYALHRSIESGRRPFPFDRAARATSGRGHPRLQFDVLAAAAPVPSLYICILPGFVLDRKRQTGPRRNGKNLGPVFERRLCQSARRIDSHGDPWNATIARLGENSPKFGHTGRVPSPLRTAPSTCTSRAALEASTQPMMRPCHNDGDVRL
jgi:hypothetical protein